MLFWPIFFEMAKNGDFRFRSSRPPPTPPPNTCRATPLGGGKHWATWTVVPQKWSSKHLESLRFLGKPQLVPFSIAFIRACSYETWSSRVFVSFSFVRSLQGAEVTHVFFCKYSRWTNLTGLTGPNGFFVMEFFITSYLEGSWRYWNKRKIRTTDFKTS